MEIIPLRPRGFCKGVVRALQLAKQARIDHPDTPITILGSIVHNRFVVDALKYYNINTLENRSRSRLELLDDIQDGIVIFSAHGVSTLIKQRAQELNLKTLDATCEDVSSTFELVKQHLDLGKEVIYVGKANHPESLGIIESFPDVHFVTKIEDVERLQLNSKDPFVSNQTTLSTLQIEDIFDAIVKRYPLADITNEICAATRFRQLAILESQNLDALVVVGDPHSNNTQMLASIGRDCKISEVITIESIEDLPIDVFKEHWRVGITSGASTPTYLTNQIIDYLMQVDLSNPAAFPEVELSKIL